MKSYRPNYHYTVFGLHIESTMPLNGLVETTLNKRIGVFVDFGIALKPNAEDGPITEYQNLIYNRQSFYVQVPLGVGAFSVHKRNNYTEVIYELWQPNKSQTALTWFYGIVLSVVLHLDDTFAMHGSGVLHNDHLHLFCGNSGMGKSTLAAGLRSKGYDLFTDDKCVLRWTAKENKLYASPSLPIMRLWDNSVAAIEHQDFLTDPVPVVYRANKSQFRIQSSALIQSPKPLKAIYILANTPSTATLACQPLKGTDKLLLLRKMVFRVEMVKGFGRKKQLWAFLQQIVQTVPVYILMRPENTSIPTFANYVEEVILENQTIGDKMQTV